MLNFYRLAVNVVRIVLFTLFRVEILGKENIPKEGAVIICPNHISNFDGPMIAITCPREINFMVKAELFQIPILKTIMKWGKAIPVRRGSVERETLRAGINVLKNQQVLAIFPEGTVSRNGQIGEGLAGVGYFALRSDATVIPCAIKGSYRLWHKIQIIYGKPVDLTEFRQKNEKFEVVVRKIMSEIKKIITNKR